MTQNQIRYHALQEDIRANKAREQENTRSNLARETETNRSNLANELETHRSNLSREGETQRHNITSEILTGFDIGQKYVGRGNEIANTALKYADTSHDNFLDFLKFSKDVLTPSKDGSRVDIGDIMGLVSLFI